MIPAEKKHSYLARQVASLVFSHVRVQSPMAAVRAAAWHNHAARLGVALPLFLTHDVGLLLTGPAAAGAFAVGPSDALLGELRLPREVRQSLRAYQSLLEGIRASEIVEKIATWRLKDELVGVLLVRIFGDVFHRWSDAAKRAGVGDLPLDPQVYATADPAQHYQDFDPQSLWAFLRFLTSQPLHVHTCVEQIDLETVRLLTLFTPLGAHGGALPVLQHEGHGAGAQLDLVDLYGVFQNVEVSDVVHFSLDLLPSVLETKRASGVQRFSADGYASIERRGNLDDLILSELAYEDDLFERKVIDDELYYYGHEKEHEEERRLQYILVDASPSMRGLRQVFARGLALTLAKKLSLQGDDVNVRFFDARLHDTVRVTRHGHDYATPYILCFRSDRGRNYARVFRQLELELSRLRREERRQVVLYIITHGQCHIPADIVQSMRRSAYLYGIYMLPSTEIQLDYLEHLHRYQVVDEQVLSREKERRERALQIVEDAARR